MALPKIIYLGCFLLLLAIVVEAATPPGIAKNLARASCKIKKYKMCYNLEHVCPKFCPDSCHVECASCKPICGPGSSPPDSDDDEGGQKGGDDDKGGNKGGDDDKGGNKGGDDDNSGSTPPTYETPTPSPPTPSPPTPSPPTKSPPTPSPPTPSPPTPTPSPPKKTPPSPKPSPPPTYETPTPSPPTPSPSPPSQTPPSPTPSPPSTPTPSPKPPTPSPSTPSTPSPSTPSTPSSPPNSGVASRKRVRCRNKNYGQCYNQQHLCPAECPTSCQVDCVTCKPVCSCNYPGAVCQDPRFVGGDGNTFYFHGKKEQNFCLVTDPNLHINAHFIGKRNINMGRDFTWVQSIGILFDNHQLFLGAKKTSTWDDANDRLSLAFDGEPIFLDETLGYKWQSTSMPQVTITRADSETNNVVIEVQGKFHITAKVVPITEEDSRVHNYGITKEDCFAHLDLGFKFYSLTGKVDGVLGKTYRNDYVSKINVGAAMAVVGGEREYATSSMFATDCLASRFNSGIEETPLEALELVNMNCASGMNGVAGVVCRR
ncbi:uncharacterized protein LOC104905085 isoform X2 [Beta vulgaris subsp. vulgaris]|uniref:uncharacterized protein LOC104905085 isoform X2 n=1 Tax=Beta vulgaris subsp. vulgaris TaxID=3555 RepID=UPI0025472ABE|nr:uncharacterized protein LOC104905085 isoform X2 [Beta vulgaris subsp. vulgaris]